MAGLGFNFFESDHIEDAEINFDALNVGKNHPCRTDHDTFFIKNNSNFVLRTHLTATSVRALKNINVPIKIFSIGKVFRYDESPSHVPMFHQMDVIFSDKHTSFSSLKGLIHKFIDSFFIS